MVHPVESVNLPIPVIEPVVDTTSSSLQEKAKRPTESSEIDGEWRIARSPFLSRFLGLPTVAQVLQQMPKLQQQQQQQQHRIRVAPDMQQFPLLRSQAESFLLDLDRERSAMARAALLRSCFPRDPPPRGPLNGGPSVGGPCAGGPSIGGPSVEAGGPSVGGPPVGGPPAGGPPEGPPGAPGGSASEKEWGLRSRWRPDLLLGGTPGGPGGPLLLQSEASRSYGGAPLLQQHLPPLYWPAPRAFTAAAGGPPRRRGPLNTALTRSRIHKDLDRLAGE
ncbi:hypothetical protein, conserved [Eimeria necatrix]|uniref:Uncharacterized protein n=1 Tax=Eimeria necatrix TaxID=51315 RepID=U6MMV9_9EIME|nr:hypothetical protein, conserved [Eimeria necatrix]CDJ62995.1 hypothetical protein, conserved [Eimeria necatrix]